MNNDIVIKTLNLLGWDEAAIKVFCKKLKKMTDNGKDFNIVFESMIKDIKIVGSPLYIELFKSSKLDSMRKLDLIFNHLDAHSIDGMLHINKRNLYNRIPPHSEFWHMICKCAQKTFPSGLKGRNSKKLHQLRYYISRNNIEYIRDCYKKSGMTDFDALKKYVKKELNGTNLLAEPARYHNRYKTSYSKDVSGKENIKRLTPDFHGEFVIDKKGHFVSQWDVLKKNADGTYDMNVNHYKDTELRKIANTESFNYANKRDEMHKLLDSRYPVNFDFPIRCDATKIWKSPSDWNVISKNANQYNIFSDLEASKSMALQKTIEFSQNTAKTVKGFV